MKLRKKLIRISSAGTAVDRGRKGDWISVSRYIANTNVSCRVIPQDVSQLIASFRVAQFSAVAGDKTLQRLTCKTCRSKKTAI